MEDIKTQRLQSMVTLEEVELKFDQQLHSLLLSHHPVSAQQLGRLSTPYTFLNTETISCGLRTAGTKEPTLLFGWQAAKPNDKHEGALSLLFEYLACPKS